MDLFNILFNLHCACKMYNIEIENLHTQFTLSNIVINNIKRELWKQNQNH